MNIKQYLPYILAGAIITSVIMLKIEHSTNRDLIKIIDQKNEIIELLEEYNNMLLDDRCKIYVYICNSK